MDIHRSLLVLICTYFALKVQINGETNYVLNTSRHYAKIAIIPHDNLVNCQNGGTQINRNTCRCPGPLFGKYCELHLLILIYI